MALLISTTSINDLGEKRLRSASHEHLMNTGSEAPQMVRRRLKQVLPRVRVPRASPAGCGTPAARRRGLGLGVLDLE